MLLCEYGRQFFDLFRVTIYFEAEVFAVLVAFGVFGYGGGAFFGRDAR